MGHKERPYLFYGVTRALCSTCLMVCDAKEVIEDGKVFMLKRCLSHGPEKVLISDDVEYFKLCRHVFLKTPEQVENYNTGIKHGCPYDCGICPDHEQHGCVSVLEITDHCNLRCPTCFASSGPHRPNHRSMEVITQMIDRIVSNEGVADVVQVSGGEPTTHPHLLEILALCRSKPIKHLMLNTNGIRIAKEPGFAESLMQFLPGFELYLQFDGLTDDVNQDLRGADLHALRLEAIARLNALNLSTTLVMTIKRGVNEDQIGDVLNFAAEQRCVRGVTLQPVYDAGRCESFNPLENRLTLSEVRRKVLEQFPLFTAADVIPVPCDPDTVAMGYALRGTEDLSQLTPLTRYVPPEVLINAGRNTIIYEGEKQVTSEIGSELFKLFSTGHGPQGASHALKDLLCCLPQVDAASSLTYDRIFRLIIMQFVDRHSLDLRTVRKSCVHIAHPDGKRMIPFDAFNLFYRDELESTVLDPIRARVAGSLDKGRLPVV